MEQPLPDVFKSHQNIKCEKDGAVGSPEFQSSLLEVDDQENQEQHIWDKNNEVPYPHTVNKETYEMISFASLMKKERC